MALTGIGNNMKSVGQRLYEIQNPDWIRVVRAEQAGAATPASVFWVANPDHRVPWHLLTAGSRAKWEAYAQGHNQVTSNL